MSLTCWILTTYLIRFAENKGRVEQAAILSYAIAEPGLTGAWHTNIFLRQRDATIRVILSRASVDSGAGLLVHAEAEKHAAWVRRGMPLRKHPRNYSLEENLNACGLQDSCNHKHAIPVPHINHLGGLNVSQASFPFTKRVSNGDHKLVVWIYGSRILLGTLTQTRSEFCSYSGDNRLCINRVESAKHELAFLFMENSTKIF